MTNEKSYEEALSELLERKQRWEDRRSGIQESLNDCEIELAKLDVNLLALRKSAGIPAQIISQGMSKRD